MASCLDYLIGCRLPPSKLSELDGGKVATLDAPALLGEGRVVVAGAPDASGPVGYGHYLRRLIVHASRLRATGFDEIVCIVTSDAFSVDAWAKSIDPSRRVRFLSDGELEFSRALDLIAPGRGDRSEPYILTLQDGVVSTARLERPGLVPGPADAQDAFLLDS
jgi:glutaredoxin/glutathione-dependent peroxiredoxin